MTVEFFCNYCNRFKRGEGFRFLRHPQSGTPRRMCPPCQAVRKLPPEQLQQLTERQKLERKSR